MELSRICVPIAAGLQQVDESIRQMTDPRLSALATGKRLRPALMLFAAHVQGEPVNPDAVILAAVLETVHTASLIHDDVLDSARQRRGRAALHRLIGIKPAVILADYLFVQALAQLERVRATYLLAEVVREVRTMCEGQWLELRLAQTHGATEAEYLGVLEKKTAALFAFCCRAGGILRCAPERELAALDGFGHSFGMAYQLTDDAQDLDSERPDPFEREVIRWGGKRYLATAARRYARRARTALPTIPAPATRQGFRRLLDHVLEI
jgi:octaprenyl-diphosphate synthase